VEQQSLGDKMKWSRFAFSDAVWFPKIDQILQVQLDPQDIHERGSELWIRGIRPLITHFRGMPSLLQLEGVLRPPSLVPFSAAPAPASH
jgi:hypothetical protein